MRVDIACAATVPERERPPSAATFGPTATSAAPTSPAGEPGRPARVRRLHGDAVRAGVVEAGQRPGEDRDDPRPGDGLDVRSSSCSCARR